MNTLVRRALQTALVSGGLVVAGASMAHAAQEPAPCPVPGVVDLRVGGTDSLLDLSSVGQVVHAPVHVPVDVSGVAVAVAGDSVVSTVAPTAGTASPSADGGVLAVPVSVPVSVSGVALGVLGAATVDRTVRPPDAASPTAPGAVGGTTGPAPGAAGESLVLAANPLPTLTDGAVLADTGWTPWLAVVALGLVVAGLAARRVGRVRPARHLLADRVPTQRGEPSPR
ncbi:MAG: hypothetical protein ABWY33_04200 [Cellulomonas sp.]